MEPRTLEELYRRYAGELYLYAYSLCQNEAQAQDLTAEAFCRALLALDGADAGWRSWLYKVCRNLWLDQVRRSRRLAPEPPGPERRRETCWRSCSRRSGAGPSTGRCRPSPRWIGRSSPSTTTEGSP